MLDLERTIGNLVILDILKFGDYKLGQTSQVKLKLCDFFLNFSMEAESRE